MRAGSTMNLGVPWLAQGEGDSDDCNYARAV
jgi:hypothetical protein